jgi:transposase-like protein
LFVVDGSKALTRGIPAVFGDKAVIHRCRIRKEKNVMGHLPDAEHGWVRIKLGRGWANPDPAAAHAELEALARALKRQHPGAAASLREGLAETLTVTRLGIGGALLKTVFSTNPVESMIEIVREHSAKRETVARRRDDVAVGRSRHGIGPEPVPPGEGLPAALPTRRRPRGRHRRRTRAPRPTRHSLMPQ